MRKARILLADDHAVVRAGIRNALTDSPNLAIVAEVANGRELAAALEMYDLDCLLLDITMPNFEPALEIRRIREHYPQLRILVVSAYDDDVYVQGLLSAGVNGYHLKSQPLSDLRLAVERVLAGERWISSPLLEKLINPNRPSPNSPTLSKRQRDILELLLEGFDNRAIANHLHLSVKTIENHLTRLYRQLNVQSRLEAVNYVRANSEILARPNKEPRPQPRPSPHIHSLSKLAILVVDDNRRYRSQLRRIIAKISPQAMIYEAGGTAEALQVAQQVTPKIAFVDVVLGNEDGIRCTRRIKAELPALRIILISAYPDREFHRRGLEAGATAFLDKKDLDAATLKQIVADLRD